MDLASSLNVGLGILSNLGQGLGIYGTQSVVPKSGTVAGMVNATVIPTNTAGLGIASQIKNPNPIASVIGQIGGNIVKANMQVTGANSSGLVPISSTQKALVQAFGVPLSPASQNVQAQSLTISGAAQTVQDKIDSVQGNNNTLLALGGGLLLAKMFNVI